MVKYVKKKSAILFTVSLLVGMMIFCAIGGTYAYFSVQREIVATLRLGKIGVTWYYDASQQISNDETIELAVDNNLVRGNTDGTMLKYKKNNVVYDATLQLHVDSGSAHQYARVLITATVILDDYLGTTANSYTSGDTTTPLVDYLTFRYIDEYDDMVYTMGSSQTGSYWWKKIAGSDYYYFVSIDTGYARSLGSNAIFYLFNNIVLSPTYPTAYMGKTLKISITYETIQADNNPVSELWGSAVATALHV